MKVHIPLAEEKLRKREKYLKEWEEEEYQQAFAKLSQWDKELISCTKHQSEQIAQIENYGQLLFAVG